MIWNGNLMVDINRNDPKIIQASENKILKIRKWLSENAYDALLLSRRENFFWLTTGGDPIVVNSSEFGVACLVITPNKKILICHSIDALRLATEQIPDQGYEIVEIKWYEGSPVSCALKVFKGRIASDLSFPGTDNRAAEITSLHYPLAEIEIDRLRWLGSTMNETYLKMGKIIQKGMTELELAAEFQYYLSFQGINSDVLIAASGERIFQYRHPMPVNKKIDKYILLHSAARKWGLHAPVTRCFHFGQPPERVNKAFQAAAFVQAATFAQTKVDVPYEVIFELQKGWYTKAGYPDEWQNHFQGGPTGYIIVESTNCLGEKRVKINTAFEWFITVPGAKIAELSIITAKGLEVLSRVSNEWPLLNIQINETNIEIPNIYIIE